MLGPLAFLVVLAVITSGIASTQTTILPASRTSLSMAAAGALPEELRRIHPRFLTPDFGTIVIGVIATVWYVGASLVSDNFLFDSLSALSLMIAFYYALTGHRLRDLLAARAVRVGEEPRLHRHRPADRGRDAPLPAWSRRRASSPTRRPPTPAARSSASACRS